MQRTSGMQRTSSTRSGEHIKQSPARTYHECGAYMHICIIYVYTLQCIMLCSGACIPIKIGTASFAHSGFSLSVSWATTDHSSEVFSSCPLSTHTPRNTFLVTVIPRCKQRMKLKTVWMNLSQELKVELCYLKYTNTNQPGLRDQPDLFRRVTTCLDLDNGLWLRPSPRSPSNCITFSFRSCGR